MCRSTWCISENENAVLLFRKTATVSEESSVFENLLDSSTDITTPRPFYEQASSIPRPCSEEGSPEMLPSYETPRLSLHEENANLYRKQPATVQKKIVEYYPLLKSPESPSPVHIRDAIIPTSSDPPPQYRHLENDDIITIHLKLRTSPFSKEEISYPGGPQFSGSSEDDEFVNRINHTHVVTDWLESQEIFDALPTS